MQQVIILEGPDGAGKTTLATRLAQLLPNGTIAHEGPPPAGVDLLQHYAGRLLRYLRHSKPVVCDRLFLGEHVYGPVARDHDRLGKRGVRMMRRLTAAYGVREVLCLPPWYVVAANYQVKIREADDYLRSRQKLWEVYNRYQATVDVDDPRVYAYGGPDALYVNDTIPEMTFRPERTLPYGAVGSAAAKLLLVGERSNTGLDLPFVDLGASSRYLDDALQLAGIPERDVAFVNAYDPGGPKDELGEPRVNLLRRTARALQQPYFVVFGSRAEQAVSRCAEVTGGKFTILPHPSKHKRFSWKDNTNGYAELLARAYEQALKGEHRADSTNGISGSRF